MGINEVAKSVARKGIGVVCAVVGTRDLRYRWLSHYLLGDGSDLRVPVEVVQESLCRESAVTLAGEPFKFDSNYTLFWLVGTMTWEIQDRPEGRVVYGVDRYDWHPNRMSCPQCGAWGYDIESDGTCYQCGAEAVPDWWWSPTSLPGWIATALRAIWPACRPYVNKGRDGNLAVSNGFWDFVGGTEFNTVVEVPLGLLPSWDDDMYNEETA